MTKEEIMSKPTAKMSPLSPQAAWDAAVAETAARPELRHRLIRPTHNLRQRFGEAYARLTALPRAQRRRLQRRLSLGLAGIALLMVLGLAPMPALADTITVNGDGTGGTCSLADAIITANSGTNVGNCTGGTGGADTINLTTDVTLNAALDMITSDITIEGNGHFISGADTYNGLKVRSDGVLTLKNTTITHCLDVSGAGLDNQGTLRILNSTISNNRTEDTTYSTYGAGIANSGTLEISNSTITGNQAIASTGNTSYGGGIYNSGTLTIFNSTISSNDAMSGAGLYLLGEGLVTIANSTINDNSAGIDGGGGIALISSSTVNIVNSTISGNTAIGGYGGGIYANIGTLTIQNSTITNNAASLDGGGIWVLDSFATVTLERTIISGNSSANPGSDEVYADGSGGVYTDAFNLFGHAGEDNAAAFTGFTPGASDIVATSDGTNTPLANILDVLLAQNGLQLHPFTHALVTNSPAIDQITPIPGDPLCNTDGSSVDQRGGVRAGEITPGDHRGGTACDIGAYEYDSNFTPTAVTLRSVTAVPNASPGLVGMLSAALSAALGGLMVWRRHRTKG